MVEEPDIEGRWQLQLVIRSLVSTAAEPFCTGKCPLSAAAADGLPKDALAVEGSGGDAEAADFFEQGLDLGAIGRRGRA